MAWLGPDPQSNGYYGEQPQWRDDPRGGGKANSWLGGPGQYDEYYDGQYDGQNYEGDGYGYDDGGYYGYDAQYPGEVFEEEGRARTLTAQWLDQESSSADKRGKAGSIKAQAPPQQWQLCGAGAGQFERQGFESWTPQEKALWQEGKLRVKWGIGQVSVRLPIQGPCSFIALVYGFLPFLIPIWWAIWSCSSYVQTGVPRFFPTFGLAIATAFALGNELVTKPLCKLIASEEVCSRPPEAVCKHCGMPSGHVMNAYILMGWSLLEFALDNPVHLEWILAIVLVMGPVPWARVYNRDHTVGQVTVSAIIAWLMSGVAYFIRWVYFPGHEHPWQWGGFGIGEATLSINA